MSDDDFPQPRPRPKITDTDWAFTDLRTELTDRATNVANKLGMDIEDFILEALDEKLVRMGLRNGPGRDRKKKEAP
jgi:hypothetical protein